MSEHDIIDKGQGDKTIITGRGRGDDCYGGYGYRGRGDCNDGLEGKDASFLVGLRVVDAVRDGQERAARDHGLILKEIAETKLEAAKNKFELAKEIFEARVENAKEADRTRDLIALLDRRRDEKELQDVKDNLLAFRQKCGDLRACPAGQCV